MEIHHVNEKYALFYMCHFIVSKEAVYHNKNMTTFSSAAINFILDANECILENKIYTTKLYSTVMGVQRVKLKIFHTEVTKNLIKIASVE
jgi:hypothetical protein